MTEGQSSISTDILARYAADAAREVEGVRALPGRKSVRIADENGAVLVELHVAVEWGAAIPAVAREVQERVRKYLAGMASLAPKAVDVVVDEVGPAA